MGLQSEQVAHNELVGGEVTTLHSHSGGGGLTTYYAESESEVGTSSTNWQTKLTYTVVEAGDYIVQWSYELRGSSTSYHCRSQVTHNTTEIGNVQFEPEDISPEPYTSGTGFKKLTLAVDDTININYCSENSTGTAYIRYARIFLLKV